MTVGLDDEDERVVLVEKHNQNEVLIETFYFIEKDDVTQYLAIVNIQSIMPLLKIAKIWTTVFTHSPSPHFTHIYFS